MTKSPKDNEEKLDQILNAWKTLASDKTFGGMTVEQFEAAIAPSKNRAGEDCRPGESDASRYQRAR